MRERSYKISVNKLVESDGIRRFKLLAMKHIGLFEYFLYSGTGLAGILIPRSCNGRICFQA
jgi:hypothetical protein